MKYPWWESPLVKVFIILPWLYASTRFYLFAPTYLESKVWFTLGIWSCFFMSTTRLVLEIPFQKMQEKGFWFVIWAYIPTAMTFYWVMQQARLDAYIGRHDEILAGWIEKALARSIAGELSINLRILQDAVLPGLVAFTICYFFFIVWKRLDFRYADYPDKNNIVAVFKYPTDIIGFLMSFLMFPRHSTSAYCEGSLFHFDRETLVFCETEMTIDELYSGEYFTINTGVDNNYPDLKALVGTKWGLGFNSLNIFKPILGKRADRFFKVIWWKK